jgi:hypothetical protein
VTSYLTTKFVLDFQEHVFIEILNTHLSGAGSKLWLRTFLKTCSWKSKIQHVVKQNVYLDALLTVQISVTTFIPPKEHPEIDPSITPP